MSISCPYLERGEDLPATGVLGEPIVVENGEVHLRTELVTGLPSEGWLCGATRHLEHKLPARIEAQAHLNQVCQNEPSAHPLEMGRACAAYPIVKILREALEDAHERGEI